MYPGDGRHELLRRQHPSQNGGVLRLNLPTQFYLALLAVQFMGPVGNFLAGAMVDGSPLVWLGERILYILGIRIPRGSTTIVLLYLMVLPPIT